MNEDFEKYIDTFTDNLLNSMRSNNTDCKKIYVVKHYNTFDINMDDIIHRTEVSPNVYYHNFIGSEMTDAFEPFLGIIRDMYTKYYTNDPRFGSVEKFLDACDIYPLHRSIFKSYLATGMCKRYEDLISSEASFEHQKFLDDMQNILKLITDDYTILIYINHINRASKSTIELLHRLYEYSNVKGLLIFAAYNDLFNVLPHMKETWEAFVASLTSNDCLIDSSFPEQLSMDSSGHFRFSSVKFSDYLNKLTNMFVCLDYDQVGYYLRIIYQKLEVEKVSVDTDYRFRFLRLYATYSIYTDDISNALLLCESLAALYSVEDNYHTGYTYHYLLCLTQMYNGKYKKANANATICLNLAKEAYDDYNIFKAELLSVMIKMSGWHNIFFCNSDIDIDPAFLDKIEQYNFVNHLARTYIYAYDNNRELYTDIDSIEKNLARSNKGIALAAKIGNTQLLTDAYRKNIMIASSGKGSFDVSNYFYAKLHSLIKGADPILEGDIYKGWGYNCCATEQYQTAHDHYNKALYIYYDLGMVDQIGEVLYNMSINCILSEDFEHAYAYLDTSLKIVNSLHMNDLRVCNISKLFGLLTLCSYRLGNMYNCQLYLDSTMQFLTHIISPDAKVPIKDIDPSYTACDDELFLYYYVSGLLAKDAGDYPKALKHFEKAGISILRSEGNQFFSIVQYKLSLAELYKAMGDNDSAEKVLNEALDFCEEKAHYINSQKILAALSGRQYHPIKYKLVLDTITLDDINTLTKQTAIEKDYAASIKTLDFLEKWQKITDITNKSKRTLIDAAINAISTAFNIDAVVYIKYRDGVPYIEYDNTFGDLDDDDVSVLTDYFTTHRSGFVTSKMKKNFNEYNTVMSIFGLNSVCSIVCIPFFVDEKLDNLFISIIYMKSNWNSVTKKYLLDDSDMSIYSLSYRQLVNALEMLEKQQQIRNINSQLEHAAVTDFLTGILNRDGLHSNIIKCIHQSERSNRVLNLSIIYIDLDHFKYYNDTFGHDIGDFILKNISKIINDSAMSEDGFAVRFGGDEFLIVLENDDSSICERIADNIIKTLLSHEGYADEISELLNHEVVIPKDKQVSASIGIAIAKNVESHEDFDAALKLADSSLYEIKHTTRSNFKLAK